MARVGGSIPPVAANRFSMINENELSPVVYKAWGKT